MDGTAPGYFFKQFCERTGMQYVCNHSFQHFYTMVLISNSIDVQTVQSCLGHSTPTTTLQIYAHTFQAAQVRAMDTVANAITVNCSNAILAEKQEITKSRQRNRNLRNQIFTSYYGYVVHFIIQTQYGGNPHKIAFKRIYPVVVRTVDQILTIDSEFINY